jgi:hypothetical protein
VDPFWKPLIPTTFPVKEDDDLQKRLPLPLLLQNDNYSIALDHTEGIENIVNRLEENSYLIDLANLFSIGLILDADEKEKPLERFNKLITKLSNQLNTINCDFKSFQLGSVNNANPRFGVFILPNNQDPGSLEDILIECAEESYPNLLELAKDYLDNIDRTQLKNRDLREVKKPAGEKKAIVSTISSVLKPGKAIQVSIQDNRWIDETTLNLPNLILLKNFLADILGTHL